MGIAPGNGRDAGLTPRMPGHARAHDMPAVVGVEGLDGVRVEAGIGRGQQAQDRAFRGAQRIRHQRMGHDRQAALIVDTGDAVAHGAPRSHPGLQEEAHQVSVAGGDLLTHDHVDRQPLRLGDVPGCHRRIDALVVGDGDDVEPDGNGPLEQRLHPVDAVRRQ